MKALISSNGMVFSRELKKSSLQLRKNEGNKNSNRKNNEKLNVKKSRKPRQQKCRRSAKRRRRLNA